MNNLPIQTDLFKPLLEFIKESRGNPATGKYWVRFEFPPGFQVDIEKVKSFFANDAELEFSELKTPYKAYCKYIIGLKGTLKDPAIGKYLTDRRVIRIVFSDFPNSDGDILLPSAFKNVPSADL